MDENAREVFADENAREVFEGLLIDLEQLTPELRQATMWVLEHLNFVVELCRGGMMSEEKLPWLRQQAKTSTDGLYTVLLCLCITLQRRGCGPCGPGRKCAKRAFFWRGGAKISVDTKQNFG